MKITLERLRACQDDAQRAQVLAAATPEQREQIMNEALYHRCISECAAARAAEDAAHAAFARQIEDAPDDAARQRIIAACDPEFLAEWLWQARAGPEDWWSRYVGTVKEGAPSNYRPPITHGRGHAPGLPWAEELPQRVVAALPAPIAAPVLEVAAPEAPALPAQAPADTARAPTQAEVEAQWRRDGDVRAGPYIAPDVQFTARAAPALAPAQRLSPQELAKFLGTDVES